MEAHALGLSLVSTFHVGRRQLWENLMCSSSLHLYLNKSWALFFCQSYKSTLILQLLFLLHQWYLKLQYLPEVGIGLPRSEDLAGIFSLLPPCAAQGLKPSHLGLPLHLLSNLLSKPMIVFKYFIPSYYVHLSLCAPWTCMCLCKPEGVRFPVSSPWYSLNTDFSAIAWSLRHCLFSSPINSLSLSLPTRSLVNLELITTTVLN